MKFIKTFGLVAMTALAPLAFTGTASATTLAVGGVTKTSAITIEASLKSGTSALLSDTAGFFLNTCTTSTVTASDSTTVSGTRVTGPISTLSWGTTATPCKEGNPTVDAKGSLSVEKISGTNGTVRSENAKVTVPSALGPLTCTTSSAGEDLGTLTGVASGNATMDINAVLGCGITVKWTGTYVLTGTNAALGIEN